MKLSTSTDKVNLYFHVEFEREMERHNNTHYLTIYTPYWLGPVENVSIPGGFGEIEYMCF